MSSDETLIENKKVIMGARRRKTSRFHGVSQNGKKWQVNFMGINKLKLYSKSCASEEYAARLHDRLAI